MSSTCTHADLITINEVKHDQAGCEECLKTGDRWVHLRICLICGHIGCCNSSKNKHATQHYHETGHCLIQSYEEGENWRWCFIDETYLD